MNKIIICITFITTLLMAKSYHFGEIRYSSAIEKSVKLSGEISFFKDGLAIKYDNSDKSLLYEDEEVEFMNGDEEVLLSNEEYAKLSQYFDLIILINADNQEQLRKTFNINKETSKTILLPHTELKNYIEKIETRRVGKELKELTMFLKNSDKISIRIENEIP